jgi:hypothetical protein
MAVNQPTKVILGVTAAVGLIGGVIASNFIGDALADRADTVVSSSADWESITFRRLPLLADGGTAGIDVTVCGIAYLANGEISQTDHRCDSADLTAPQQTTVNNIVSAALARWKAKRGL